MKPVTAALLFVFAIHPALGQDKNKNLAPAPLVKAVRAALTAKDPKALLDLHDPTGVHPIYRDIDFMGCQDVVNELRAGLQLGTTKFISLASMDKVERDQFSSRKGLDGRVHRVNLEPAGAILVNLTNLEGDDVSGFYLFVGKKKDGTFALLSKTVDGLPKK